MQNGHVYIAFKKFVAFNCICGAFNSMCGAVNDIHSALMVYVVL